MRFPIAVASLLVAITAVSAFQTPLRLAPVTSSPSTSITRPFTTSSITPTQTAWQKTSSYRHGINPLQMSDAAAAAAEMPNEGKGTGTASMSNEIFNLVKSIVGAGVLSLPAGKKLGVLV